MFVWEEGWWYILIIYNKISCIYVYIIKFYFFEVSVFKKKKFRILVNRYSDKNFNLF